MAALPHITVHLLGQIQASQVKLSGSRCCDKPLLEACERAGIGVATPIRVINLSNRNASLKRRRVQRSSNGLDTLAEILGTSLFSNDAGCERNSAERQLHEPRSEHFNVALRRPNCSS